MYHGVAWRIMSGMKLYVLPALAFAALSMSACGAAGPDVAAAKSCGLLLTAVNRVNVATWEFVQAGEPKGGSAAARAARDAYPSLIADAADAAPATLADRFSELKRYTMTFVVTRSDDAGVAMTLAQADAVSACESAGVDMPVTNPRTGVVS